MSWKNAGQNQVAEAGTYHVEIKGYKDYKAMSGNPCLIIEHTIIGPTEGVGSEMVGRKMADFITLTESATWKLGWFVGSCGIVIADLPDMDTGSEDFKRILNMCKGRRLWVTVTKEVYNGKDVNKFVDYMPDEDQEEVEVIEEVPEFLRKKKEGLV